MFADAAPSLRVPVIVLVADGARADAFDGPLSDLPALRRLRDEGGLHRITTAFPSVTGPAYTPFLLGRFPGLVGIPALRWYDRSRTACSWPDYARSYVGIQVAKFDGDLDPDVPTIFDLAPNSLAAMSVVTRGLARSRRLGTLTPTTALRVALTHFRGRLDGWFDVDRDVADAIVRRHREERPDYLFAAFVGVDKSSHAEGHESPLVHSAIKIIDDAAGRLRADAEAGGWWDDTHLWIVSDHGHSAVYEHEDLAGVVAATGARTVAHPWAAGIAPDAAVMVSGNAMAHLYVELKQRTRPWWQALEQKWSTLTDMLATRDSVDLMLLPHSATRCEVRSASRGNAIVARDGDVFRYARTSGDPLDIGRDLQGTSDETHDATRDGTYPDALVQILSLAGSARAGDIILSATPGWDFRAKYEPIPHRSAHGALHRDHMLVPLLTNRPPVALPRRTTDIFASAVAALRLASPAKMDGRSFL